ncbi:hypothetical protein IAT38_005644 [Cryptococcus sp. DSM 104549]
MASQQHLSSAPVSTDPFHTPSPASSLSALEHDATSPPSSSFVPPPLPPRPPAASRKPVPAISDEDLARQLQSTPRSSAPPPPALPPRPPAPSSSFAAAAPYSAPSQTYNNENIVDHSRLPPPPPPGAMLNEKQVYGPYPARKKERWWYPATTRGRRWWWASLLALIVAIVIVVAVLAKVLPKKHTQVSSGSSDNGGHPLSEADGGPNIGQPGDIVILGNRSADHFVMTTNRSIVVTRLDPIVNPNSVGSHVHRVHGSSYFTANLTTATEMEKLANCTTTVVQKDLSAYWVAALYYRYKNGTLANVRLDRTSLYYFQKAPTGVPIYPFPDNYNLVAGDPMRRAVNYSDPTYTSKWFQCYRGGGNDLRSYGFPKSACSGGLVQAIQFPSCWDGVYAEDGDYSTHVSYPTDNTNGYHCPDAFPKKFITLQFETVFAVYDFPYNGDDEITWVLANGDTSGYGIHADFMNGWNADTLQGVLDDCRYMNSTAEVEAADEPANCPHLNSSINLDITYSCRLQTQIVDEDVGQLSPIEYLPGCNGIWTGNTSKPACPGDHVEGGYLELTSPGTWYRNEPYL